MSSSAVLGQYLWHELLTPDPEAGTGFYGKVLGWSRFPYEGDASYSMLGNAQGPVGGARVVGKDPLADKAGPNWLTYVGVPDLTAALALVEGRGGRVVHPVTSIPEGGGRYAVIADPQGATIGLYQPAASMTGDGAAAGSGPVVWHELTAENPGAALQFYNAIFGWDVVATHEMGGNVGTYYLFGKGTTQMGGAFIRGKDLPPTWPRWLVYLAVPGVVAAAEAVVAAGGTVLNGPHQVPGGNWIVQVVDSHGVPVALHGPKQAAKPAAVKPAAASKPAAVAKPQSKAKPKAKAKAKPKAKAKAKPKAKPKAKAKTKTKTKAKAKKAPKAKAAARRKGRPAIKSKAKTKPKPKRTVKAKRKAARRGK